MITLENSFLVDKSAAEVYGVFAQIENIAWAFPTVTRVDVVDEDHVNVGILLKMGLLALDNNLTLEVRERTPGKKLVAGGVAIPGKGLARAARLADKEGRTHINMVLDLDDLGAEKSRIRYKIDVDAQGNLKRVYDAVIKGQRVKLESGFIANVAKILGAPITEEKPLAQAAS